MPFAVSMRVSAAESSGNPDTGGVFYVELPTLRKFLWRKRMDGQTRNLGQKPDLAVDETERERIIWHGPNVVVLCMDSYSAERQDGRLYHQYTKGGIRFDTLFEAMKQMDAFYDEIRFPFASTENRSFYRNRRAGHKSRKLPENSEFQRKEKKKMETFEDVVRQRGTDATFIIRVSHRQHASWQGEVTWVDEQKKEYFRSALELVRLIDGALDGGKEVSES